MNEIWNNKTVLDVILDMHPFQTIEEAKADMEASAVLNKIQMERVEKLMSKSQPDSYEWLVLKETLEDYQKTEKKSTSLGNWRLAGLKVRSD